MKVNFTYGPNLSDSELFDIGQVTLNREEAVSLALAILMQYMPHVLRFVPYQNNKPMITGPYPPQRVELIANDK